MRGRDLLIVAGLVATAVGLAAVVVPGVVGFSLTDLTIMALGGLMLLHATLSVAGADPDLEQANTDDPERRREMPRPGDEADLMLASFHSRNAGPIRYRRQIRDWVADVAVGLYSYTEDVSEAKAKERIQDRVYASRRELQVIAGLDRLDDEDVPWERGSLPERLRRWARQRNREESRLQGHVREALNTVGSRLDIPPLSPDEGFPEATSEIAARLDPPIRDEVEEDERKWEWEQLSEDVFRCEDRDTGHWTGMISLSFAFGGVGVLTTRPTLLLAAVVGMAYAAYARHQPAAGTEVDVSRSVEPAHPDPGEETTVTLTITNEGESSLPDVRVVDGVPARLEVVSGVARLGTALRPGEQATLEYAVETTRGRHEFDAVTVISRDPSGAAETELVIDEDTELTCVPPLQSTEAPLPLRELAVGFVGRVAAEQGGGVEFYAVREYRPGDPPNRIDWNRHARTGQLATLQFREERSTTVLLLIDTREASYVAPGDGEHAVDRGVDAAGSLFEALTATSNRVGVASLSPELCWLDPDLGSYHERRVEELLGSHPGFGPLPPRERRPRVTWLREIRRRLPEDAQVVYVTPLCDDFAPFVARRLEAYGHPVTVLSPDPTAIDTVGGRLAHLQRRVRVLELRGAEIPVIDWEWDVPLEVALSRESRRRRP